MYRAGACHFNNSIKFLQYGKKYLFRWGMVP